MISKELTAPGLHKDKGSYVLQYGKNKYPVRMSIRMSEQESKKQKLTLSVDKDVIEKARNLGMNISEITEKVLRGFTFTPTKADRDELSEKYKRLFDAMLPLLQKYNTSVMVGYNWDEDYAEPVGNIELLSDGTLWAEHLGSGEGTRTKDIRRFAVSDFLPPKEILSNFIRALSEGAERENRQLAELEMARRIIEAITGTSSRKSSKTRGKIRGGKR